jgi:hypothetical protein
MVFLVFFVGYYSVTLILLTESGDPIKIINPLYVVFQNDKTWESQNGNFQDRWNGNS